MAIYKNLKPEDWAEMLKTDPEAMVLDVRTASEHKSGSIEGSINVTNIHDHLEVLDKSKSYFLHCRVGGRSAIAAHIMANNGFEKVYNCNGELVSTGLDLIKK